MQLTMMLFGLLFLLCSGWADTNYLVGLAKKWAAAFLLILYISEMFLPKYETENSSVRVLTMLLLLFVTCCSALKITSGWQRYRCVLCASMFCLVLCFCALYFNEYTDRIMTRQTALVAFIITAFSFIFCSEPMAAFCSTCLCVLGGYSVLNAVQSALFFSPFQIADAPMLLCLFYCWFELLGLYSFCDILQARIDARKRVKP